MLYIYICAYTGVCVCVRVRVYIYSNTWANIFIALSIHSKKETYNLPAKHGRSFRMLDSFLLDAEPIFFDGFL